MVRVFLDQLDDAARANRNLESAELWLRTATDVASSATKEHLRKESTVAKRIDSGSVALAVPPERSIPSRRGYVLASLPFLVILLGPAIAPGLFEPVFANPPELVGLPLGVVVFFMAAVWGSIAFLGIRLARSRFGIAFALLVFTVPSLVAIVATPSLILAILRLNI
jgi:hypothetical protein